MHDGAIVFNTKIDNSNVEKDLKDLEKKIRSSEESISKNENAKLPLVKQAEQLGAKLDEAKRNLAYIRQEMTAVQAAMAPGSTPADYMTASADYERVKVALDAQEKEVVDLQKEHDKLNNKVDEYNLKIQRSRQEIERNTAEVGRLRAKLGKGGNSLSGVFDKGGRSARSFSRRIWEIGKSALVFNVISTGLRGAVGYLGQCLKTNAQFTAQLANLKGALLTAFQPIYEVVLPALIQLMRVLTALVQVVGNFFAAITGKSSAQMAKNAKALNKEASAISGVGDAAEEASKQLMGFDEINRIESPAVSAGGAGAGNEISPNFEPIEITPDLERILALIGAIGAGFLAWRIASAFTDSLSLAAGLGIAIGSALFYAYNWADAFANGIGWENLSGMLLSITALVGGLALAFGPAGAAIGLLVTSIGMAVLALREWVATGELSNEACAALVAGIMGIGTAVSLFTGNWIPLLIAAIASFVIAAKTKGEEIKAIFNQIVSWFKDTFLRDWTEIFGERLGTELNIFFQTCAGILDGLETIFGGLIDFIQAVFAGNWSAAWNGLASVARGAVNGIIAVVNGMIAAVTNGINALFRLLSIRIELPNGGAIGWSLPQFTAPQIPYLAAGAVIPPNKEFMAVLGDQSHGRNLEAPEGLIRQIVREESGGKNVKVEIEFTGSLAYLAQILAPEIHSEIEDMARAGGW